MSEIKEKKKKTGLNQDGWYVAKEEKQEGPYSLNQMLKMINQGIIGSETPVWKKGMPNWTALAQITEFQKAAAPLIKKTISEKNHYSSKQDIIDLLAFRRMITPIIIQILFWLNTLIFILIGINFIFSGISEDALSKVLIGLTVLILCPLIVRVLCELMILFFKMNETLKDIRNKIEDRQANQ